MFSLEDREICKNCEYKEICAGECDKTYKNIKEKTADEMFEELGYVKSPSLKTKDRYEKAIDDHIYYFIFNNNMKIFSKTCDYGKTHIRIEELQAINKKCKELGWI